METDNTARIFRAGAKREHGDGGDTVRAWRTRPGWRMVVAAGRLNNP
jgi:hypothetical protein